jgi:serine/threonine protein kinase
MFSTRPEKSLVDPEDFVPLQALGKGGFGKVMLVTKRDPNPDSIPRYYAMKEVDKQGLTRAGFSEQAIAEKLIMEKIDFPFVMKLHFCFQTTHTLYFLLDYLPGGDLAGLLESEGQFSQDRARFYLAEITLALGELHKNDIIHRDLKPANVRCYSCYAW